MNGLWEAINDGTIDMIGTDHAPHTKEEKDRGWADMWSCPGGEPQIQDYLSLFLDAVNQDKLSLDRLVRISSFNPAKVFNIYPKKGVLLPGSDADMVIVDMNKEEVISNETTYTKVGWTPYHNRKVKGVPIRTILRGKTVMQDGKIVGKPGDGQLVKPLR